MQFDGDRKKAIEHVEGNLQLIACAGAGKTEIVARRVANLLKPKREGGGGCVPANIVAFTFTEKAAGELKERIYERVQEALGTVTGLAEMYVGTIHGFCLDLLRTEVPQYMKYEVLNEVQQTLYVDRHSKESGLTRSTTLTGIGLKRYVDTRNYVVAQSILREDPPSDESLLDGNSVAEHLGVYEQLLHRKGYLDYSGILKEAVEVLTNDDALRKRLAERIKHVIVDEYQDVNPIQEAVVWTLHNLGAGVCVVGDDDQTIYQWRGSDVGNILEFANRYPKVEKANLEENFRSSEGVVAVAREFIKQNVQRLSKEMKATTAQDYEVGDIVALGFDDLEAEAKYIAETCKALRGVAVKNGDKPKRGIAWSDMAILLRSVRRDGTTITDALKVAGVPFVVTGMDNLFSTPEAQAARDLFYYLANGGMSEAQLKASWEAADLGLEAAALEGAIDLARQAKADMAAAGPGQFKVYNLQRRFMWFLEDAGLREERVPNGRGEVVFYNLGKFSQVISDFESINFHSNPPEKYASFAKFLQHGAEHAYPEGWQDGGFANPDAVRVMTVHQAKGMQWPVVFVPQLTKNRFPSKGGGGRTPWSLIPAGAFQNQARYRGGIEDERRLFYVAVTRAQKFLHLTWAPTPGNKLAQAVGPFFTDVLASKYVKRRAQDYTGRERLPPEPKKSIANVVLSFSDLKYYFECPYQFKLRILYGFNAPLDEALGYGKSLHDALAEVHKRALAGEEIDPAEAKALVKKHLRVPYAYKSLEEQLAAAAETRIGDYIRKNAAQFKNLEFSEKGIEIALGDGVSVVGRIDLVRRLDNNEVTIVDLKSSERAQADEVTETQLHIYALGYQELTGRNADKVEVYELDHQVRKIRSVQDDMLAEISGKVKGAAEALRTNALPPKPHVKTCTACDYCDLCSAGTPDPARKRKRR